MVGRKIDITNFNLEVEEGHGIRYVKENEITDKFALIFNVYEISSYEEFVVGVNAHTEDEKVLLFILTDSDDIIFEVKEEII